MVTKDDPFKAPASGLRKAAAGAAGATSKPAAAPAAAAPRAAASPSRARAGAAAAATKPAAKPAVPAAKPAATAAPKPPAVKAPAAAVKAPAAKVASPSTSSPKAAAPKAAVGTTKAGSSAAPKAATKAGAGAKAGAVKGTGKAGSKGTAAALEAGAAAAAAAAAPAAVEAPGPDPQEEAARRAEMEAKAAEEMEALRKAAWQAQVDYERRQEAKRRQAREEEAKRKKEEAALRKQLLEAAYDGEVDVLRKGLSRAREAGLLRPDPVDAADGHGNTLLSEAAAGGQAEAAAMLLQMGAHPNSRGEFQRTPLWRAAFLGKEEVIPILLHGGADPRIGNEGGELPEHVAPAPLRPLLAEWDTARTDALVAAHEARRAEAAASAQAERAQAVRGAEAGLAAAEEAHVRAQQALRHSRMELEKRITEYDICVEERKPEGLTAVALDQVKQQEQVVATAKGRAAEAAEALDAARLALREHQQQQAAAGEGEGGEALPGLPVAVKALNDVLIRDVGGKLAEAGRWPLVIDSSGQASVFLRYQDINYVNALNSRHMEPGMLRRALLGGLRYGKPLVLDLQDCDLWSEMPRMFDQVHKGLLASLLDRSLLAGEAWAVLIRPEDGDEYDVHRFQDARLRAFRFIVLTASPRPPPELLAATQALRVVLSET